MRFRSSFSFRHFALAPTFALAMIGAIPAIAGPVTFGQYFQTDGAQQQWAISTSGGTTTVQASGDVLFDLSSLPGLPFDAPQDALFTLNATSETPGNCGLDCSNGDSLTQQGYSGTFSFIDIDAGFAHGTNLLSGTFAVTGSPSTTGGTFSSSVGGTGGSFDASSTADNLGQLVFTSAYLNFAGQTQETSSWSLSSLIPNFAVGPVVVNGNSATAYPAAGPFDAAGSGTFSSNPGPTATPEPASVALLGAGLIGLAFARRRRASSR